MLLAICMTSYSSGSTVCEYSLDTHSLSYRTDCIHRERERFGPASASMDRLHGLLHTAQRKCGIFAG
jgi:hypothetical protein